MLNKDDDKEELGTLRKRLAKAIDQFTVASQIKVLADVGRIEAKLVSDADYALLNSLAPVGAAKWDSSTSPSGCLQNTRVALLDSMIAWVQIPKSALSLYWLASLAGMGKSTIAKSFCQRIAEQHSPIILLSFFASKSSAERSDPFRMLYTLAYQLARADHLFREHLLFALRDMPDVKDRPMSEQVTFLLKVPLTISSTARNAPSIVLVIDALDECLVANGLKGRGLVPYLVEALQDLPLKLVVTSRMEEPLIKMFNSMTVDVTQILLQEIDIADIASDVHHIFVKGFAEIATDHQITGTWPSNEDLNTLINLTGHLLVFASTVLKYVRNERYSAEARLQDVLARSSASSPKSPFQQLDLLYTDILLNAATDNENNCVDLGLCHRIRSITGAIVLLVEPLSITSLATLLGMAERELNKDVRALSSVFLFERTQIGIDSVTDVVRIFHPSFRDFLLQRCADERFLVMDAQQQRVLGQQCLTILNLRLHENICEIQNPTLKNQDITDLPDRLREYVSDVLKYASLHWITHVLACEVDDASETLADVLSLFMREHSQHWVELLSLLNRLTDAMRALPKLIAWSQKSSDSNLASLANFFHDLLRTLLAYPILDTRALQVYSSTWATMPDCPLLQLWRGTLSAPKLISKRRSAWPPMRSVFHGHTWPVATVVFSPDGSCIASGSRDDSDILLWDLHSGQCSTVLSHEGYNGWESTIVFTPNSRDIASISRGNVVRIWDVITGQLKAVLNAHEWIWTMALSSDGKRIALGTHDSAAQLWDVDSGQICATLKGHTGAVVTVVFSPDGTLIITGSKDHTIRMWTVDPANSAAVYEGHTAQVTTIAISPDGQRFVSGSEDCSVRLWDVLTGQQIAVLNLHTKPMNTVTYSPDGRHVASCSGDHFIGLWDGKTGQKLTILKGHSDKVSTIAFSPVGRYLASGSCDRTVRIWDTQNEPMIAAAVLEGHTRSLITLAYSPDGARIASGGSDNTVRIWDTSIQEQPKSLDDRNSKQILAIAFSPDGRRVGTGSEDRDVRLWDAVTGDCVAVLSGHQEYVQGVAFSHCSQWLASASGDRTIRLWDARSGKIKTVLEGETGALPLLEFSPNGRRIASRGEAGYPAYTVRVWDVDSGTSHAIFEGHTKNVGSKSIPFLKLDDLRFSSDGKHIVSRCTGSLIHQWDISEKKTSHEPHLDEIFDDLDNIPGDLVWDCETRWLSWRIANDTKIALCWLPDERGGYHWVAHGNVMAIGTDTGAVTIVDLSGVLALLRRQGLIKETSPGVPGRSRRPNWLRTL